MGRSVVPPFRGLKKGVLTSSSLMMTHTARKRRVLPSRNALGALFSPELCFASHSDCVTVLKGTVPFLFRDLFQFKKSTFQPFQEHRRSGRASLEECPSERHENRCGGGGLRTPHWTRRGQKLFVGGDWGRELLPAGSLSSPSRKQDKRRLPSAYM